MGDRTLIEWTDASWNPVTGCTKVSPGCDHCYAESLAERFRGTEGHYFENGFDVQLRPDKLDQPLRWRRPRRIFVNSMSDLFHDGVPDLFIAEVFAVMALSPHHTFQILTKRPGRMRSLLNNQNGFGGQGFAMTVLKTAMTRHRSPATLPHSSGILPQWEWPLPNVWLGVSTEDQKWADVRIPQLLETPGTVRFISAEPLLGEVMLPLSWLHRAGYDGRVDWIIVGGESGRGARPMHPDWVRTLRDQCQFTGTAFHFKQWGEWRMTVDLSPDQVETGHLEDLAHGDYFMRVGKKMAGRELDGRTWDEQPCTATEGANR